MPSKCSGKKLVCVEHHFDINLQYASGKRPFEYQRQDMYVKGLRAQLTGLLFFAKFDRCVEFPCY